MHMGKCMVYTVLMDTETQPDNAVRKKVLLVEDDTFLRDLVTEKLAHINVQLLQAGTGEAALEIIKKEKPALVLLDIVLPGISGFDVLTQIRADEAIAKTPVVILSNLGQEKDIARAKELGVLEFIIKVNVNPSEIVERVQALLA